MTVALPQRASSLRLEGCEGGFPYCRFLERFSFAEETSFKPSFLNQVYGTLLRDPPMLMTVAFTLGCFIPFVGGDALICLHAGYGFDRTGDELKAF